MSLRIAVFAATLLLCGASQAAVYKCKTPSGTIEFKDQPCAPGTGGEIAVKGVAPADRPAAPAGEDDSDQDALRSGQSRGAASGGSAQMLSGRWCEYAVSLDLNGDKDTTAPVEWNFTGDNVEYRTKGLGTLKGRVTRSADGFTVDNPMFGGAGKEWKVVTTAGGATALRGPYGGYMHMRRGGCS